MCAEDGGPWGYSEPEADPESVVEVVGCRCMSPACPLCGVVRSMRASDQIVADCKRLGVEHVTMLTGTTDPKRFPDPEHLFAKRVIHTMMAWVWGKMPASYVSKWGSEPVWWCCRELHDGKRRADGKGSYRWHVHILMPSPQFPGRRRGRLPLPLLKAFNFEGVRLSGRWDWGWKNQLTSLPVEASTGYVSKGVRYASKGSGALPDAVLAARRVSPFTRSRGATLGDPGCVSRRDAAAEKRRQCFEAVEDLTRLMAEAGSRRQYGIQEAFRKVRAEWRNPTPRVSRVVRTTRERLADCCSHLAVLQDGRWVQNSDVPLAAFQAAVGADLPRDGAPGLVERVSSVRYRGPAPTMLGALRAAASSLVPHTPPAPFLSGSPARRAGSQVQNGLGGAARTGPGGDHFVLAGADDKAGSSGLGSAWFSVDWSWNDRCWGGKPLYDSRRGTASPPCTQSSMGGAGRVSLVLRSGGLAGRAPSQSGLLGARVRVSDAGRYGPRSLVRELCFVGREGGKGSRRRGPPGAC